MTEEEAVRNKAEIATQLVLCSQNKSPKGPEVTRTFVESAVEKQTIVRVSVSLKLGQTASHCCHLAAKRRVHSQAIAVYPLYAALTSTKD